MNNDVYALRGKQHWYKTGSGLTVIYKGYSGVWVDVATFDTSIAMDAAQKIVDALNKELP